MLRIVAALRRRWPLATLLGIALCLVGGVSGWFAVVPEYTAAAYLRIDADNRPLIFETADQSGGGGGRDFRLLKNTHQQLMKTPFVLNAALRDQEVAELPVLREQPDPVGWLQEHLNVTFPQDGEIMSVSLATADPTACVKLVNAVTSAFMDEVVVNERTERLQRVDSLERVYAEAESKVRNRRAELKTLATALGTGDSESLTVAQQAVLEQYGMMQQKLTEVQFLQMQAQGDLEVAEAILAQRDASSDSPEPDPASEPNPASEIEEDSAVAKRLASDIESLRRRLSGWAENTPHPNVQRMKEELLDKEQLLDQERRDAVRRRQELSAAANRVVGPDGQAYDLAGLRSRIEVLRNQEDFLREKVEQLEAETRELGSSSIDIELMRGEIESLEGVLKRVGEESERTSIELRTNSRIKLLSPAEKASPPSSKKRLTLTAALGLCGLLAPFALLIAWDISRKPVDNVEWVRENLSLATLGIIPWVSGELMRSSQGDSQRKLRQRVQLKESIDSVAALIHYRAQHEDRQLFLVSSAEAGEGKTTVACQLAFSIAEAGLKVALLDFDLRRPMIHRLLGLEDAPGIAEVLAGKLQISEATRCVPLEGSTTSDQVHVLTAGKGLGKLREKCVSGQVQEMFDSLRQQFDVIIVDAPPILPVVDTRVIAEFADGVIMTLLRDKTRLPLAIRARELLGEHGVKVLGTIFIGGRTANNPSYDYQPTQVKLPPE